MRSESEIREAMELKAPKYMAKNFPKALRLIAGELEEDIKANQEQNETPSQN